jgi:hypothetical protein
MSKGVNKTMLKQQQQQKQQKQQQQQRKQQQLIDEYFEESKGIEDEKQRLEYIKTIPIPRAKFLALVSFSRDYPEKLNLALDLVPTDQKEKLFSSAIDEANTQQDYQKFINSLETYPKFKSEVMSLYLTLDEYKNKKQSIQKAKQIPDQQIRYATMAQFSKYISSRQERLSYIGQILNEQKKSQALYDYSLQLPPNNSETLKHIMSIPNQKWRSQALAQYSFDVPFVERYNFINSIPNLEARQKALAAYVESMPIGQQREKLIQTLTSDDIKSEAMQNYAKLLPFGQRRIAYLQKIPDEDLRHYLLKQYDKLQKKQRIKNQVIKALEQHRDTTVIDDFEFIAVFKANREDRNYVQVISKNIVTQELNTFYVYQSNSEIGAWRYCRENKDKLYKGDDYITVTFVHIELQKYLFQVFDTLKEDTDFYECPKINSEDAKVLNSRIVKDSVFDLLSNCESSFSCFHDNDMLIKKMASLSTKQQWTPQSIRKLKQMQSSKPFLENVNILIQAVNSYLQSSLSIDFTSFHPIYSYTYDYTNQAFFDCTIYKGSFKNLKNGKQYYMFINHYHYRNTKYPQFNGTYSMVVFIAPHDAKITKNGIYDKVLRTGIYAYKAIEYKIGMDIFNDAKQRERDFSIEHQRDVDKYKTYYFIGDIMNEIWPLKDIRY